MPDIYTAKPRGSTQQLKNNRRVRKFTKRTLWRDNSELEAVGRSLLSVVDPNFIDTSADLKQQLSIEEAFDAVSVWKARAKSGEGLPHAVESTYHLAHVYWRDAAKSISTTELRLSYSSAIVRTINGFADVLQQQRFVASSVSLLCSKLGIPAWIVDVRHEASHNALPSLGVLRLATCTLMEFLKSEYWIPMCDEWKVLDEVEDQESNPEAGASTIDPKKKRGKKQPIDYLLAYKTCATSFFSPQSTDEKVSKTRGNKSASKQQAADSNPLSTILLFDPLFGDASSDEDDWEDPILGNIRGNYIGTSTNRFALLEPPKSKSSKQNKKNDKSKKKKKGTSNGQPTPKKKPGEKYPMDHAKDFVTSVSPQEGYSTALIFLVYGGIGGSPAGRGVLIPGSTSAFPATEKGVLKSWKRYSTLLQVLGRVWPGFCSCLLVHLVDFVLSIEDSVIDGQHHENRDNGSAMDPGSARKLFFLSAWIRLLLSQQFISTIDPTYVVSKTANSKKNGSIELTLAELSYLQKLGYPLNSIADRCSALDVDPDLRSTSRDILRSLEEILGESRVPSCGLSISPPLEDPHPVEGPSVPSHLQTSSSSSDDDADSSAPSHDEAQNVLGEEVEGPSLPSSSMKVPESPNNEVRQSKDIGEISTAAEEGTPEGTSGMSLDEMEALLSEGQSPTRPMERENSNTKESDEQEGLMESVSQKRSFQNDEAVDDSFIQQKQTKRIAWARCVAWDRCSLGTLPGHPV